MSTRFQCDYAKRASSCKKCKMQLPKGVLRLAKIIPNFFIQNPDGPPPDMKQYFHPVCLFEMLTKARVTTKVIDSEDDVEGFGDLKDEDKEELNKMIAELQEHRQKLASDKTPKKRKNKNSPSKENEEDEEEMVSTPAKKKKEETSKATPKVEKAARVNTPVNAKKTKEKQEKAIPVTTEPIEESKFNSFNKFAKVCGAIAEISGNNNKSEIIHRFITNGDYDGDAVTFFKLLLPSVDQRVYNLKEKQLLKHFSAIYGLNHEELVNDFKSSGDAPQTICDAMEKNSLFRTSKSDWSIQKIDRFLNKLTEFSQDEQQTAHLKFAAKRLSPIELLYLLRLIMKDLRFNAGVKIVLDGLNSNAYEAFQSCRDLEGIVKRCLFGEDLKSGTDVSSPVKGVIAANVQLGKPVLPMLAEACKSVEIAMKKLTNGMFAEIKYDGERVQVHKNGAKFSFFSRSLKPVLHHKIAYLDKSIPQAFANGDDLILDGEVLMVDNSTGKPLPFGTLGVHKKEHFKNASVCIYVFDILRYNDKDLTKEPLEKRKEILKENMVEIPNQVLFSNYQRIEHGDKTKLQTMIWKAIDEGLEGLVMKDVKSLYEPGKRHWMKVKKDYLEDGGLADTADLLVLGGYFGTGAKGGILSVFLMGVHDKASNTYRTVTKCGNGYSDEQLDSINQDLKQKMKRIDCDHSRLPSWLHCNRGLVPDFVIEDPKDAPVWEITGAEFSKSDKHTANGISIRFPRVTRFRDDKDVETATSLEELKTLYKNSKIVASEKETVEDDVPLYAKPDQKPDNERLETASTSATTVNTLDREKKPKPERPKKERAATSTSERKERRSATERSHHNSPSPTKISSKLRKRNPRKVIPQEDDMEDEEESASSSEAESSESEEEQLESSESDSESESEGVEEEDEEECPPGMTACWYGKDCYRKNPDHKKQFWHPKK